MQTPTGKGAIVRRLMRATLSDWMVPDFGLDGSATLGEARTRSARASQAACQRRRARQLRIVGALRDCPASAGGASTAPERADGPQA